VLSPDARESDEWSECVVFSADYFHLFIYWKAELRLPGRSFIRIGNNWRKPDSASERNLCVCQSYPILSQSQNHHFLISHSHSEPHTTTAALQIKAWQMMALELYYMKDCDILQYIQYTGNTAIQLFTRTRRNHTFWKWRIETHMGTWDSPGFRSELCGLELTWQISSSVPALCQRGLHLGRNKRRDNQLPYHSQQFSFRGSVPTYFMHFQMECWYRGQAL
jgi:hypothetical protein